MLVSFTVPCYAAEIAPGLSESSGLLMSALAAAGIIAMALVVILNHFTRRSRKRAEQRFRQTVDQSRCIYWEADLDNVSFTFVTESSGTILGYTPEEWYQPGFWIENMHPDDRKWVPGFSSAHVDRRESHDIEYRFRNKAGQYIWVRDSITVVGEGNQTGHLCGVMRDISAEKNTPDSVRKATLSILEASPVACALSDSDQKFIFINQAFIDLFGYQLDDIPTADMWREKAYPDPVYRQTIASKWPLNADPNDTAKRPVGPSELNVTTNDGRQLVVVGSAAPFGDAIDGVRLVIFHDITERKISEDEIKLKNTLLATQLEASIDAVLTVDNNGKVISANRNYADMWGLSIADFETGADACSLTRQISEQVDSNSFMEKVRRLNNHTSEINFDEIVLKDGRVFDRYSAPLVGDDGKHYGRLWSYRDTTERKKSESLIWKQANFDSLTGLPNRRMLQVRLEQEIKQARRYGGSFAVLSLDLDHFKEVNDTLGHAMGDELLQDTARRLSHCVRDTDAIARLGGDEFIIMLAELDDVRNVERVANKILDVFREPFHLGEETAYISTSIGITFYPQDARSGDALLKAADQAMYAAKKQGRSGFSYFTVSMQEQALSRMHLLNDLRSALEDRQLSLAYQPIVDLKSGEIKKAEALLRWKHPEKGVILPAEFVHISEETSMIVDIGDWVFREAAQQCQSWRLDGAQDFQISINASPVQFRETHREPEQWFDVLRQLDLPGNAINVEITEGLLMETRSGVIEKLLAFRDAGIQVSIDDFGTGYSSLSYLKRFNIDYLKIDQSFVSNLAPNSEDLVLCEAIIVMAHKLNLKVIAEGVETEQQRELLSRAGCDFGQGHLFSRPLPGEEFNRRFLRSEVTVDCA